MPTYEYLCETCGERFEVIQSIKDASLETHPKCKHKINKVRRIITGGVGFIRKGSGWTESSKQTKEKHEKIMKLRQDSHMNDEPM